MIQRSRVFGFPDRITAQFFAHGGPEHATLAVYSRAQVGYSDLGVNRKRIDGWLDAIAARLGNGPQSG